MYMVLPLPLIPSWALVWCPWISTPHQGLRAFCSNYRVPPWHATMQSNVVEINMQPKCAQQQQQYTVGYVQIYIYFIYMYV